MTETIGARDDTVILLCFSSLFASIFFTGQSATREPKQMPHVPSDGMGSIISSIAPPFNINCSLFSKIQKMIQNRYIWSEIYSMGKTPMMQMEFLVYETNNEYPVFLFLLVPNFERCLSSEGRTPRKP